MARVSALLVLLVLGLAAHAQARGVLQTAPAKTTQAQCTPKVVKPPKALCLAQLVRKVANDPKSAAIVVPASIADIVNAGDAACAILTPGTVAVPETIKFSATSVDCFNGKATVKGATITEIACCAAGTSLASWRTTRAQGGQIEGGFARIRTDSNIGPQINPSFSRVRETAAENGGSISTTQFGH